MAKLSSKQRKKMPTKAFAMPSKCAYPIHDQNHARLALAMVSKYGSPEEKVQVRNAVHKRYPGIGQGFDSGHQSSKM